MPLKVATINVNGIRAAFKNGMAGWLSENTDIDVFALQEVRAETKDLVDLFEANPPAPDSKGKGGKWFFAHDAASAKGRAGVAIVSKTEPIAVRATFGPDSFDSAGRWLEADFKVGSKVVTVISTYVHSGEVDTPKQVEKYKFLEAMQERMAELVAAGGYAVVVGDLNVGHTELDIKNWKGNLKNAGFLPEERAYFDTFMNAQGWVDIGRATHPGEPGPYTWWSYRGKAFDTDAGWRIDYHLATPKLAAKASNYKVHRAPSYDTRWTDHSPVVVDYAV